MRWVDGKVGVVVGVRVVLEVFFSWLLQGERGSSWGGLWR